MSPTAAAEVFANLASTTVTSGGTDAPVSGTTQTWVVASSALFPAASTGVSQFRIVEDDLVKQSEIILVTNVSGTTWSVTRGAEGTTPIAHLTGFTVRPILTKAVLDGWVDNTTDETIAGAKTFSTGPQVFSSNPTVQLADGTSAVQIAMASSGGSFHTNAVAGDMVVRGTAAGNTQGVLLAAGPTSTGYVRVASAGVTVGGTLASGALTVTGGASATGGFTSTANGATSGFGNAAATGVYVDATNVAVRLPGTSGTIFLQSASGSTGISAQYVPSTGTFAFGRVQLSGSGTASSFASTGTTGPISVGYNGATEDNNSYGIVGITAPAGVNQAYYSMTAAGNAVFGMGMGTDNTMRIGAVTTGKAMNANAVKIDGSGNVTAVGFVNGVGGTYDNAARVFSPNNRSWSQDFLLAGC